MSKIAGIADIQTDIAKRTCSFRIPKADAELKAKLDELGKSNTHMEEFQIVEGLN